MLTWIRSLFATADRASAAAERTAAAWEEIADMTEAARDEFRQRLNPAPSPKPIAPPDEDSPRRSRARA